jgi:hypothetical protein
MNKAKERKYPINKEIMAAVRQEREVRKRLQQQIIAGELKPTTDTERQIAKCLMHTT